MTLPIGDHTSWAVQFTEEQARLWAALRHVTDGGVILNCRAIKFTPISKK